MRRTDRIAIIKEKKEKAEDLIDTSTPINNAFESLCYDFIGEVGKKFYEQLSKVVNMRSPDVSELSAELLRMQRYNKEYDVQIAEHKRELQAVRKKMVDAKKVKDGYLEQCRELNINNRKYEEAVKDQNEANKKRFESDHKEYMAKLKLLVRAFTAYQKLKEEYDAVNIVKIEKPYTPDDLKTTLAHLKIFQHHYFKNAEKFKEIVKKQWIAENGQERRELANWLKNMLFNSDDGVLKGNISQLALDAALNRLDKELKNKLKSNNSLLSLIKYRTETAMKKWEWPSKEKVNNALGKKSKDDSGYKKWNIFLKPETLQLNEDTAEVLSHIEKLKHQTYYIDFDQLTIDDFSAGIIALFKKEFVPAIRNELGKLDKLSKNQISLNDSTSIENREVGETISQQDTISIGNGQKLDRQTKMLAVRDFQKYCLSRKSAILGDIRKAMDKQLKVGSYPYLPDATKTQIANVLYHAYLRTLKADASDGSPLTEKHVRNKMETLMGGIPSSDANMTAPDSTVKLSQLAARIVHGIFKGYQGAAMLDSFIKDEKAEYAGDDSYRAKDLKSMKPLDYAGRYAERFYKVVKPLIDLYNKAMTDARSIVVARRLKLNAFAVLRDMLKAIRQMPLADILLRDTRDY